MSPKIKRPGSTLSTRVDKAREFEQRGRRNSNLGKPKAGETTDPPGSSSGNRSTTLARRESLRDATARKAREQGRTGKTLRNNRRKRRNLATKEATREWKAAVTAAGCAMEGPHYGQIEGHHILPKQALKREGHGDKLWDVRNGIGLCQLHHANHEGHSDRLPRTLLPAAAFDFAAELDLTWLLDREYPDQADPPEGES